ncbi:ATP-binding protein [Bradyrhizobium sp. BRP56]|uniref:ATP-binding protein n=1 Tax=Bradyrhizobium sp. BRP56 TaxID=2793819 RepID=UPI001CD31FD0|nr:ATP-binding protein [Bradyrhizobium sp. BRP56]MCA1400036.1 AAA family ATPase [Bradyrhizobium sp. BRP56]
MVGAVPKLNPFRPGSVISPGTFVGRIEEIDVVEQSLLQTRNGNPQHFIIEGERGIGKSSLCLWVDYLARGDTTYDGKNRLSFIVVNTELHAAMGYDDIVDAILAELKRQIANREPLLEACKTAWDFLSRFQVSGVKYDRPQPLATNSKRLDELTDVLVNLIEESLGAVEGVLILIDEADRPPSEAHLGQLCKLLTERLSRRRCERVCIGLSGLPDLMQKLKDSHESSLRIFNILELKPLEFAERMTVIDRGIEQANKSSDTKVEIEDNAKRLIANLSEGYPHFLQEFAHCAFATDSDNNISVTDVLSGTFSEHGALNQLGRKYFADLYIDQIGSEDYRRVLIAMADHMDDWVGRQTIINSSGVKESIVNNALSALRERKIILSNPRARGEYRLPTRSFAVWIKARETQKKAEPALSVGDTASVINVLAPKPGANEG